MKEKILAIMKRKDYRPIREKDLVYLLGVSKPKEREALKKALDELIKENKISINSAQRYEILDRINQKEGVYRSSKGSFGFVEIEDELFEQDVYVPSNASKGAFNQDRVLVQIINEGTKDKNPEGKIIKILERAPQIYVGIFHKNKNFGFVVPDDKNTYQDVFIPKDQFMGAKHLDKVQIEIIKFPQVKHQKPEGKILHVLGSYQSEGIDMLSLAYRYQLPIEFSPKTEREAESLVFQNDPGNENRVNLSNEIVVTIDGITAKDLDDAVCVKKIDEGWRLIVSIADVSFYVKENSSIDQEAYERGTSVYLPDRAIPMLPKRLSENLCSLNPNEEKLTFSVDMTIDTEGKIVRNEFYKSIIRSKARFVYDDVNQLISGDTEGLKKEYLLYEEHLIEMKNLAEKLHTNRMNKGAIDLDIAEPDLIIDTHGNAIGLHQGVRGIAERMIEEFMLAANRSVAEYVFHTTVPSIYRVHEEPDAEKLKDFVKFASMMGFPLHLSKSKYSSQLNEFVGTIKNSEQEYLLKKILLRCMKKAEYRSDNTSHFALAFAYYTHFTSPIRRYPDLMVHRILSKILDGELTEQYTKYLTSSLPDISSDCSKRERRAEEAEREAEKIKIAQYMSKHRGDIFEGLISSIINFGMFVQLSNMAEGLIKFADMGDDYYEVDDSRLRAVGRRKGKVWTIGDPVVVEVFHVDKLNGEIDLILQNDKRKEH